jgi:alanine dehydrogenase
VIVDVAVDQGGCIATTHETSHTDPVYEKHGVIHYAVGNMPGAVPNTSTYALTNATLPYQIQIASLGARAAAQQSEAIRLGVNAANGHITSEPVARELSIDFVNPNDALL